MYFGLLCWFVENMWIKCRNIFVQNLTFLADFWRYQQVQKRCWAASQYQIFINYSFSHQSSDCSNSRPNPICITAGNHNWCNGCHLHAFQTRVRRICIIHASGRKWGWWSGQARTLGAVTASLKFTWKCTCCHLLCRHLDGSDSKMMSSQKRLSNKQGVSALL